MTLSPRSVLLTASLLFSLPALAYDWDWDDEIANRQWRASTLDWAASSHPATPSPLLLMATTAPPPRELWCSSEVMPTLEDCKVFESRLKSWTQDYLKLPHQDAIPAAFIDTFPSECDSICR